MPTWSLSIVFLMLGGVIAKNAIQNGGVWFILLWPAVAFVMVAIAYWQNEPGVFGKQANGTMSLCRSAFLAPFLLFSWLSWQIGLFASSRPAWQKVSDNLFIGRRLHGGDPMPDICNVIDLTAEFVELHSLRSLNYRNIALLDGSFPDTDAFIDRITEAMAATGPTYIHCAMGHGRTGLAAATWLMLQDRSLVPEAAVEILQRSRPSLALNHSQMKSLRAIHATIAVRSFDSTAAEIGSFRVPVEN